MPKATLVYHKKHYLDDGSIIEGKIWKLPEANEERPHGLKYSFVYIECGVRVVGYDNERGKGDHRHWGKDEHSYQFVDSDQLIDDFFADVDRWREGDE